MNEGPRFQGQENSEAISTPETTSATFRQDVLVESNRQPVLVDFWAPWCAPCRELDPILKKVIGASAGKAKLVKMNIEEFPQIAGQLGIKSIPAVVAFQNGQPIDGFAGALPESQIRGFLERIVGPISSPQDQLSAEGEEMLLSGNVDGAISVFQALIDIEPANSKAISGMAHAHLKIGDLDRAKTFLANLSPGTEDLPEVKSARAALALAEQASKIGNYGKLEEAVISNPGDHASRFDLAIAYDAGGLKEKAADALLEIIKRDRKWKDDGARQQLLQFFELWGLTDPETINARRKLSSLLFS